MSHTFNLSVKDYEIQELKELLNLNEPYTLEDIVNNQTELQEKLLMDTGISQEKKSEIINFLEEVKNILIRHSKKEFEKLTKENSLRNSDLINSVKREKLIDRSKNVNIITKLVSFDSRFRDNYFETLSTDYLVNLTSVLKNVVSIELGSIEIPGTFYQISKKLNNDFFWIEYTHDSSDLKKYYIDIPEGNYDRETMVETIKKQIQDTITGDNVKPHCEIKEHTGKILIGTDTSGAKLNIYFNKQRYTDKKGINAGPIDNYNLIEINTDIGVIGSFGWLLGFRSGSYLYDETIGLPAIYMSEGCYDGWGTKYLYLVIDDFNNNSNTLSFTNYNSSLGSANILARIATDSISSNNFKKGSIIQKALLKDDYTYRKREYFGPVDITKIGIRLIDDIGRTIDLNNMDFSFALNVNCLYDKTS
tara:strand:- start:2204 stop:3460 length:1257 start_codon:yes stop_codon:yes gene_type:complete